MNISNAPTPTPASGPNVKVPFKVGTDLLLGVNGTGQRKDYSVSSPTSLPTSVTSATDNAKPKLGMTLTKTSVTSIPSGILSTSSVATSDEEFENFDVSEDAFNKTIKDNLGKTGATKEDYFQYYNSTTMVDEKKMNEYWDSWQNFTVSALLSKSHRRAIVSSKFIMKNSMS